MTPEDRQQPLVAELHRLADRLRDTGWQPFQVRDEINMGIRRVADRLALLLAEAQLQENKEVTTRGADTQYGAPLATASKNQPVPTVPSCHCPAAKGEDCPLTQDECDARTEDHIGHPWFGARLRRVYDGFVRESMNGVVCSIPDTGLDTPPHRTWCVNCQRRYMELKALVDMLERQPAALPETSAQQDKEKENDDDQARGDRLSTSSDASRTAATDVAEGERSTIPDQGRNDVRLWACTVCGIVAPWPSASGWHSRCGGHVVELSETAVREHLAQQKNRPTSPSQANTGNV